LIELVVVVAVLAVLATIALPRFADISGSAAHAAAKNSLATMVKECQVKIAMDGSGTHGAVQAAGGVLYTVATGNSCGTGSAGANTNVIAAACSTKGTPATYAANLTTGAKIAAGNGGFTDPDGTDGDCPSTATAW